MNEPSWTRPLRKALGAAADHLQGEGDPEPYLREALEAGWPAPTDDYHDFWTTAEALVILDGALRAFPVSSFFEREWARAGIVS